MYLRPIKNASGAYPPPQSARANGLLTFPGEFVPIFYPSDKQAAGFVDIEHDGTTVTSCVWNEEAYQAYIASLPEPEPAPEPAPTDTEVLNALLGMEVTL